jgi:alpha-beta hydrolase superfamily lysophospholipase
MEPEAQEKKVKASDGIELWMSQSMVSRPKAVIVIVHGVCEFSSRYDYVVSKLNSFGYSVYRFDLRGHGRSGGERGYVEDYQMYVDDTDQIVAIAKKENDGTPIIMLAHSMGGFIAAHYGVKYPDRLLGQVLSGAAVKIAPMLENLESTLDYNATPRTPIPNSLIGVVSRDQQVVKAYDENPLTLKEFTTKLLGEAFIKGARQIMDKASGYRYPCLILHGGGDLIVNPDASRYFYEHISSKDKQLKIYDGLFHEILNEPEKDMVLEDIHQWIEARV